LADDKGSDQSGLDQVGETTSGHHIWFRAGAGLYVPLWLSDYGVAEVAAGYARTLPRSAATHNSQVRGYFNAAGLTQVNLEYGLTGLGAEIGFGAHNDRAKTRILVHGGPRFLFLIPTTAMRLGGYGAVTLLSNGPKRVHVGAELHASFEGGFRACCVEVSGAEPTGTLTLNFVLMRD